MAETQEKLSVGQWLKQHRKALDLTQEGLAERIGCSYIAIHKIEAGTRRPSRQLAELLADLFKVPAEEREAFIGFARGIPIGGEGLQQSHYSAASVEASKQAPTSNLPTLLTHIIGREEVAARIGSLRLQEDTRLLTLTGPPGIGKTRLAIEVAKRLLHGSNDGVDEGVFFVTLAPINDPDLVAPTIAQDAWVYSAATGGV